MSATLAPIPTHALLCWLDDRNVYISVPHVREVPCIFKYPLSENGLGQALNFLRIRYEELPSAQKNYVAPPLPITSKNGKPPIQTEQQRDAALAILRKMGLV